jgi:hypothetical protein
MPSDIPRGNAAGMAMIQVSINVASVAVNTTAEQTFTVNGLRTTDMVFVNKPSLSAGLGICNCRVSAANTLAITFNNNTAGAIDPVAETYNILVIRPSGDRYMPVLAF